MLSDNLYKPESVEKYCGSAECASSLVGKLHKSYERYSHCGLVGLARHDDDAPVHHPTRRESDHLLPDC